MEIIKTPFEGLFVLQTVNFQDNRGGFQKLFNFDFFKENGLDCDFKEFYYSVNKKDVVRGMHFQLPPFDHTKVVYVSKGRIKDVVVDIRKQSATYRKCFSIELDDQKGQYLYIPKGFAHGFYVLSETAEFCYKVTDFYHPNDEGGIRWNDPDIGVVWPLIQDVPVLLSEKDQVQPFLKELNQEKE